MEVNPYAAPQSRVDDVAFDGLDLEARKASRGKRLGAALLDILIAMIAFLPPFLWGIFSQYSHRHIPAHTGVQSPGLGLVTILMTVLFCVIVVIDCVMLHKYGQTMGKRIVGIKIMRTDGERISLRRVIGLRTLPISILSRIPFVGWLIALADSLMIFGAERRCLHDVFADSIVIND